MAAHDLRHLCPVRWTTSRRVDYLGRLAEILRTYSRWRDHAERFHILDSIVIGPVNGAARNAKCLSWSDVHLFPVDGPGRHILDAVDRNIRFTKRGRAAYSKVHDILREIEHEWSTELGSKHFTQLKELLSRVWESRLIR